MGKILSRVPAVRSLSALQPLRISSVKADSAIFGDKLLSALRSLSDLKLSPLSTFAARIRSIVSSLKVSKVVDTSQSIEYGCSFILHKLGGRSGLLASWTSEPGKHQFSKAIEACCTKSARLRMVRRAPTGRKK